MEPPPSDEFTEWATSQLKITPDSQSDRNWININVGAARSAIQDHPFLVKVQQFIAENRAGAKPSKINIVGDDFTLYVKSFDSVISKLFRTNVLENNNFPNPPNGGWVDFSNIFDRLNDLVRTTITCRFFDEPRRISEAVVAIAQEYGLRSVIKAQAKDVGYYAYHVYVSVPAVLVDQEWRQFERNVQFEIQVTTEIQYVLYDLTHKFYEEERHKTRTDEVDWKWSRNSARFSVSYVSHSLHLLEGLIQRLYEDAEIEAGKESNREPPLIDESRPDAISTEPRQ